jgi:type II secretory pathway component GspD/PulD (secretin)
VRTTTPLNKVQALQLFDSVLAQNGIAMVLSGDQSVKAVTTSQATSENPPEITLPWKLLPESSSPMTRTVKLKNLKPSEIIPAIAPFAKLPNSILAIDGEKLLILRDYSENIRKQLELLEQLDRPPVR